MKPEICELVDRVVDQLANKGKDPVTPAGQKQVARAQRELLFAALDTEYGEAIRALVSHKLMDWSSPAEQELAAAKAELHSAENAHANMPEFKEHQYRQTYLRPPDATYERNVQARIEHLAEDERVEKAYREADARCTKRITDAKKAVAKAQAACEKQPSGFAARFGCEPAEMRERAIAIRERLSTEYGF